MCAILATLSFTPQLIADYPIASHRYLADPSSLVTKDRVYIYCSDDDESPVQGGYNIPDVVCVSSSDMKNWTDHGSVFRAENATKWAKKSWAPAAIERDGKFFLYFGNSGANIGVVTAYNDMLSAHQPYENYPEKLRRLAHRFGASAQVAGGVPAMCDGVTQGQPGMELSLFSRDQIAMSTAIALSQMPR